MEHNAVVVQDLIKEYPKVRAVDLISTLSEQPHYESLKEGTCLKEYCYHWTVLN